MAKTPLVITKEQRQALTDLKYTKEYIDTLKPEEVQSIIANNVMAPAPTVTQPAAPAATTTPAGQAGKIAFNPLQGAVDEKGYAGASATGGHDNQQGFIDIPEHNFTPPPGEEIGNEAPGKIITNQEKKQKEQQQAAKNISTGNPDLANVSEGEKREGAAAMTDVIITGWETAYKHLSKMFMISEKSVNKMQAAGQIDVRLNVPYKMDVAPLTTVFRDYNNEARDLLILEDDFKKQIHPMMTEELAKAGHGLTNKQQLIGLIGMKLMNDAVKAYSFVQTKKDYLKFARDVMKTGGVAASERVPGTPAPIIEMTSSPNNNEAQDHVLTDEGGGGGHEETGTEGMTLQEAAIQKFAPGGVNNTANFGNRGKLKKLDQVAKADKKVAVKKATSGGAKVVAKNHIANAKAKLIDQTIPTAQNGRKGKKGRPPGSKNKKSNLPR